MQDRTITIRLLSVPLIIAVLFSSVGWTVTETVCTMQFASEQSEQACGTDGGSCCAEESEAIPEGLAGAIAAQPSESGTSTIDIEGCCKIVTEHNQLATEATVKTLSQKQHFASLAFAPQRTVLVVHAPVLTASAYETPPLKHFPPTEEHSVLLI